MAQPTVGPVPATTAVRTVVLTAAPVQMAVRTVVRLTVAPVPDTTVEDGGADGGANR